MGRLMGRWMEMQRGEKLPDRRRQLPQNSATTTSAVMIELDTFRILIPLYTGRGYLQQSFRLASPVLDFYGTGVHGMYRRGSGPHGEIRRAKRVYGEYSSSRLG